jgi:hypothetical protein
MREILIEMFEAKDSLSLEQIVQNIAVAAIMGLVIFISYWISHSGTIYSKKFNVSLIVLTVLTATVMATIGNNVALSLGMVGALSIVRYRTAIKDSRDTVYIFWTVITGICCGVGDYVVCSVGSGVVFIILMILGRIKNENRMLIVIRGALANEKKIEVKIFKIFKNKAKLKVKNSTPESIEYIYEVPKKYYDKVQNKETGLFDTIYKIGDIDYVNVVIQNDDIA